MTYGMNSAIASVLLLALTTSCNVRSAQSAEVPDALKAPPDQVVSIRAVASGVQIYGCKAGKDDATRFEWVLAGPEASLVDSAGKNIGKHYAGPTWEANDASKVVGEVKAKNNSPDPNAIPWLLLAAKSNSGNGIFAHVTSVQRLNTQGGKAPADGCSQATIDTEIRVPYKATYTFYVAHP